MHFILVMGTSGTGKSTIVRTLSETFRERRLTIAIDADDFHTDANKLKMQAGVASVLAYMDRRRWFNLLINATHASNWNI